MSCDTRNYMWCINGEQVELVISYECNPVCPEKATVTWMVFNNITTWALNVDGTGWTEWSCTTNNKFIHPACFTDGSKDPKWNLVITHWYVCVDKSTDPPTTKWFDFANNELDQATYSLTACDIDLESDPKEMCNDGTTFLRWFIKQDGLSTGDFFDTTMDYQPYTPVGAVSLGACGKECKPAVVSFKWDDISNKIPFTSMWIKKPSCCELTVVTTAGTFILYDGDTGIDIGPFDCEVELTSIAWTCLDKVKVFQQRKC